MAEDEPARSAVSVHEPLVTVCRQIRHSLRTLLTTWGVEADAVDDALLVVEELVANVIDHARTRFQLVVRLTGRILRVAVRDCAVGLPQVAPFDPNASRGRGLQVVDKLALKWGFDPHDRGKTVWVDLAV